MTNFLDDQSIELTCPSCGHKFTEKIGRLKTNPKITCASCNTVIDIKANQFTTQIAKAEKSFAELQRTLSRFGK